MENQTNQQPPQSSQPAGGAVPPKTQATPVNSAEQNRMIMGILAYLGILVLIPLLTARHDEFIKFHIKQGLVLFCIELIIYIIGFVFWPFWMLLNIVNLGILILSILGIVNVVHKKQQELPIVGHLGSKFPV